jgi:hypothetical protein
VAFKALQDLALTSQKEFIPIHPLPPHPHYLSGALLCNLTAGVPCSLSPECPALPCFTPFLELLPNRWGGHSLLSLHSQEAWTMIYSTLHLWFLALGLTHRMDVDAYLMKFGVSFSHEPVNCFHLEHQVTQTSSAHHSKPCYPHKQYLSTPTTCSPLAFCTNFYTKSINFLCTYYMWF